MARGLNHVYIVGSLVRDPELRYTPSGTAVANLDVAGNSDSVDESGAQREIAWYHRVTIWRRSAEIVAEQLKAGAAVFVEGSLRSRSWETPEGLRRSAVDIEAARVEPLQLGIRNPDEAFVADTAGGQRLRHGLNQVMVVGNLTRDAELRFTPQGTALLRFSLAVNERYQDRSGAQQERTDYINIVAWRQLAEAAANMGLTQGDPVLALGRFQSRSWTDSEGQRRRSYEIEADRIELMTRAPVRDEAGVSGEKVPDFDIDEDPEIPPEEDLPF